jgi:hypothetical protein
LLLETLVENALGIVWASAIINGCIAVATRVSDVIRDIGELQAHAGAVAGPKHGKRLNSVAASVAVVAACLSILWVAIGSLLSPEVYTDLAVPAASLLLLCTKRGMIFDVHPVTLSCTVASTYLLMSTLYSIFIMHDTDEFLMAPATWYEDSIVSVWSAPNWWTPCLCLLLTALPMPAIVLGLMRRKDEAEEVMFVLAILGLASLIGGELMSIRLLGFIGMGCGFWRVYDLGMKHTKSNRLI